MSRRADPAPGSKSRRADAMLTGFFASWVRMSTPSHVSVSPRPFSGSKLANARAISAALTASPPASSPLAIHASQASYAPDTPVRRNPERSRTVPVSSSRSRMQPSGSSCIATAGSERVKSPVEHSQSPQAPRVRDWYTRLRPQWGHRAPSPVTCAPPAGASPSSPSDASNEKPKGIMRWRPGASASMRSATP